LSIDRAWYEKLGGFTDDYIFGHYEDADLCLKSLHAGTPAWLHDIRMLHLEGKGSRRLPQHEGGSLVNRWNFSRTWIPKIVPDMVGRTPQHRLLGASAMTPGEAAADAALDAPGDVLAVAPGNARAARPAMPAKPHGAKRASSSPRAGPARSRTR
jgi:hypothetical protein